MAFTAYRWAWEQAIPSTRKLVLLALVERADSRNQCFPSVPRIAADTGLDRKTVSKATADLVASRLLVVERHQGAVNRYRLNMQLGPKTGRVRDAELVPKTGRVRYQPVPKTGLVEQWQLGPKTGLDPARKRAAHPARKRAANPLLNPSRTHTPVSAPIEDSTIAHAEPHARRARKTPGNAKPSPAGFDAFWVAYPRKVAKPTALKAWERLKPDPVLLETILASIERQAGGDDWRRDDGRYIPHPTTWLNARRWEDEGPEKRAALGGEARAPKLVV